MNNMEVVAKNNIGISPRKVNLVASAVRNKKVVDAIAVLSLLEKRTAMPILKTLKSAVANAVNNNKLSESSLWIKRIDVSGGVVYKRFRPSTRGRVHPYKKRTTHFAVVLEDKVMEKSEIKTMPKAKKGEKDGTKS